MWTLEKERRKEDLFSFKTSSSILYLLIKASFFAWITSCNPLSVLPLESMDLNWQFLPILWDLRRYWSSSGTLELNWNWTELKNVNTKLWWGFSCQVAKKMLEHLQWNFFSVGFLNKEVPSDSVHLGSNRTVKVHQSYESAGLEKVAIFRQCLVNALFFLSLRNPNPHWLW